MSKGECYCCGASAEFRDSLSGDVYCAECFNVICSEELSEETEKFMQFIRENIYGIRRGRYAELQS
jgi:hypothetical protein